MENSFKITIDVNTSLGLNAFTDYVCCVWSTYSQTTQRKADTKWLAVTKSVWRSTANICFLFTKQFNTNVGNLHANKKN